MLSKFHVHTELNHISIFSWKIMAVPIFQYIDHCLICLSNFDMHLTLSLFRSSLACPQTVASNYPLSCNLFILFVTLNRCVLPRVSTFWQTSSSLYMDQKMYDCFYHFHVNDPRPACNERSGRRCVLRSRRLSALENFWRPALASRQARSEAKSQRHSLNDEGFFENKFIECLSKLLKMFFFQTFPFKRGAVNLVITLMYHWCYLLFIENDMFV